ncbi:hypothetical protein [Alkalicella caledoniensis]|uniref:hypothetical protein n=1 Tax=Alkalicella caledoniensis TaxID=2731377 RepID=UPI0031B61B49
MFNRYQTHKVIRVSFDDPVNYVPPFDVEIIDQNPLKLTFRAQKNDVREVLKAIMSNGEISDISIEEEDIGNVVERIYESKMSSNSEVKSEIKGVVNE